MFDRTTLNENQIRAVETESQYTRVVAGAGSGKTRVLTHRIAYLIEEKGVYPSQIMGLTFTNKAAQEIRGRMEKADVPLQGIHLSTIHSWCARFLRIESKWIGYPSHFSILDDDDQEKVMKDIFVALGRTKKDPEIKEAMRWIAAKKMKGFQYQDLVEEEYPNTMIRNFMEYFSRYTEKLKAMNAFDFDDLMLKTIEILEKNQEVRLAYQKRLRHILVDEFQDINDVQFRLITLLMNAQCALYVVGDPDQTIYTWRGANHQIMTNLDQLLSKIFSNTKLESIILNKNYRSTQKILSTANLLIKKNQGRLEKDLIAVGEEGTDVSFYNAYTARDEASYVANTIKEIHKEDQIDYKEIAILYRANYLTRELENQLNFYRIPYRVFGGMKFFQRKEIKEVLCYLRLLVNPFDDLSLEYIINVPTRNIGPTSVEVLKAEADKQGQLLANYLFESTEFPLPGRKSEALKAFVEMMVKARCALETMEQQKIAIYFQNFLESIGYLSYVAELEDGEERKENVMEFIGFIEQFFQDQLESDLVDFVQNCNLQSAQDEVSDGSYVSLMTIHTSKGLEFDSVFVFGLNEGVFPSARSVEESKLGMEEERRLAYVAFTRARKKLVLTCNQDYSYILQSKGRPSRFMKEAGIGTPDVQNRFVTQSTYVTKPKGPSGPIVKSVQIKQNTIQWAVGDRLEHDSFGYGNVVEIIDKLIVVHFDNDAFGKKTLVGSHHMLKKVVH